MTIAITYFVFYFEFSGNLTCLFENERLTTTTQQTGTCSSALNVILGNLIQIGDAL